MNYNLVVLAAGFGTRLYPLTKDVPKALLPINGKAVLDYFMDPINSYYRFVFKKTILVSNNKFYNLFNDYNNFDLLLNNGCNEVSDAEGPISDLFLALHSVPIRNTVIFGSDNLFSPFPSRFLIQSLYDYKTSKIATTFVSDRTQAKSLGVVCTDFNDKVTLFEEKPKNPKSSQVVSVLYYFPKTVINFMLKNEDLLKKSKNIGDLLGWVLHNFDLYAVPFGGDLDHFCEKWYDIGTIEVYNKLKDNSNINQ